MARSPVMRLFLGARRSAGAAAAPVADSTPEVVEAQPAEMSLVDALEHPSSATPSLAIAEYQQFGSDKILILVGADETARYAHKSELLETSKFFAAALDDKHGFREARESVVRLPGIDIDDFDRYLQWLCSSGKELVRLMSSGSPTAAAAATCPRRTLSNGENVSPRKANLRRCFKAMALSSTSPSAGGGVGDGTRDGVAFFPLIRLWETALFLQDERCCNDVIDEVFRLSVDRNAVPSVEDVERLWASDTVARPFVQLETGRGLKGLILDLFALKKTSKLICEETADWNQRFLRELVVKLRQANDSVIEDLVAKVPTSNLRLLEQKYHLGRCEDYHLHTYTPLCLVHPNIPSPSPSPRKKKVKGVILSEMSL